MSHRIRPRDSGGSQGFPVQQGALAFQRQLSAALPEQKDLKVYSVSPFDLDERRRFKDRFGGDVVYFFNDAARDLTKRQPNPPSTAPTFTSGFAPR